MCDRATAALGKLRLSLVHTHFERQQGLGAGPGVVEIDEWTNRQMRMHVHLLLDSPKIGTHLESSAVEHGCRDG